MPSLTDVYLPHAFLYTNDVTIRGSTHFILLSQIDIGAFENNNKLPKNNPKANVCDMGDLNSLHSTVSDIVFNNGSLSNPAFTVLDLCRFKALKRLVIGDGCCKNVKEVKLIGLSELESIIVDSNSFTKNCGSYEIRRFCLKNCPKLRSLRIGSFSFNDYSVIEIENVDALEVIEMGELDELSASFNTASLELKSILSHKE